MLDERTKKHLDGVHSDLVRVFSVAESHLEQSLGMIVTDGLRTYEEQRQLLKDGASTTMNSRHLTGHAIDIALFVDGKITWNFEYYKIAAQAMKKAAQEVGVAIEWGGDWSSFRDGTHFQLSWQDYPITKASPKKPETSKTIATATLIPITATIGQLINAATSVDSQWVQFFTLMIVLVLSGYIIYERVLKIRKDGI